MIDAALEALLILVDPIRIVYLFIGIAIGFIIGFLPGLGGTVGMALVLPFVFGMDPYGAMALLIGMIAVIHTSDTFTSVLFGIPGTAGSQATIMDGFPLSQKGEAARALSAAFISSMFGGIIGAFILFLSIPIARPLVLSFGSPELFMLTLFGVSTVSMMVGKKPIRGFIVAIFGLMLGAVGGAPATPEYRFTFDWLYLYSGLSLIVIILGFFAIPEMIQFLSTNQKISRTGKLSGGSLQGIRDVLHNKWLVVRSSALGAFIGFVPGLGGSVVDWLSYGLAKKTVKNSENFGKGDIRGVIAPESSNNAKEGGGLIPTLLFSVPGSGVTAVLLGGLVLLGIEPGPKMVTSELPLTLTIVWTLALGNVFGTLICFLMSKPLSHLTTINPNKLVPFLIVIIFVGAYQAHNHWGDFVILFILGALSWFLKEIGWPRIPFIIGFVLSTGAERYLSLSMSRYGLDWMTRPGVIIIGIIIILVFFGSPLYKFLKRPGKGVQV